MNKNRLLIAVIVMLGLGGAAVATLRSRAAETTQEKPAVSLPALKKDDITSVEIENPKKGNVTFTKLDGKWTVTAPLKAQADQSAVNTVADKLAELEATGVAATRKENHARLEVDSAHAIHVKVKQGDKQAADLWFGASKNGSTMVRIEGQDTVVTAKGTFSYAFDKDLKMFRDRVILDVDSKDVKGLELSSAKGKLIFSKGDDGNWTQVLAKGEKPIVRFASAKVESLSSTLTHLRAADFAAPEATPESLGLDAPTAKAILTKADGTQITLELGSQDSASSEYALRLVGNEVIFRVSKYNADRLLADASTFQEAEKKEGAAPEAPPPPDMAGGEGQIPPELLRQLQQQLGAQGMGGMGHP